MTIAVYAIIFFLALARYNARSIIFNCQESGCSAGLSCVDANNEVCKSERTLNCKCKPEHNRGLIVTCYGYKGPVKNIYSVPIAQDGTPSQDVIWSHRFTTYVKYLSVDVDNILQQAYVYEYGTKTIQKNPNYYFGKSTGNIWTTLHKGISASFLKLAVDWISHNIYWTDPTFRWIMVQSLLGNDSSMHRVLIHENLDGPQALALDPLEALLFWSDIGTFTKIEVSSLSGRNRTTLICSNLLSTYSLAADNLDRRLYFVDAVRDTVETVTYDGKDRKILIGKASSYFIDITVYKDYLYVADMYNTQLSVINKTNGNEKNMTIKESVNNYFGVAVFHHDIHPSSVTADCVNYGCEHICLMERKGAMCICKDGYNLNQDMKTCSLYNEHFHRALVFSNESNICIVDIRVLADFVFDPVCVLETAGTKYMIMDTDRRQIIIANDTAIYWARVDNPELHRLTEPSGIISGMAWDGYDRNLYWTEEDTGKIWRISVESGHVQVFLEGLTNPRDILLLPHDRLMYWISDRNGSTIESSNIDDINLHVVLNSDDLSHWKFLSYDQYNERIYFLSRPPDQYSEVISCNLDGSDTDTFLFTFENPGSLEIFKGYLLVTDNDPEGTIINVHSIDEPLRLTSGVFKETGAISDIKIFDENNRQNESGPCFNLNGECEQICIANGMSRICKCTFGFRLAGDGETCISDPIKDNFMLVGDVTHKNIYQVSLKDQSVQGIKAKGINPIYNPVHESLLWRTKFGDKLFSMHLNGTGKKHFPVTRYVFLFDVDYSTGNIYYVSKSRMDGEIYLSVISPDGKHLDLHKVLDNINGLVVYPSEGYMFYLHSGSLVRATMNGNQSEILLDGLNDAAGLTIDYKNGYLYWIEKSDTFDGYNIEYCQQDGTNNGTLFEIKETFLNKFVPSDLAIYEDYLFIAFNKQSRLLKLMISTPNEMTEFSVPGGLGRIEKVNIYSSGARGKNAFCSEGNGGCSTFCLPVPGGGICGCEDGVDLKEGSTSLCSNIDSVTTGL